MTVPASAQPDARSSVERLVCTTLWRFEVIALEQYQLFVPGLPLQQKRALVDELGGWIDEATLEATRLGPPVRSVIAASRGAGAPFTLVVQGLVLESLGRAIYTALRTNPRASDELRSLAARGEAAGNLVLSRSLEELRLRIPEVDARFELFCAASGPVLGKLDSLGEPADELFAEALGIGFAEVVGEVSAELVASAATLGMNRRKLVCHLASAFMAA